MWVNDLKSTTKAYLEELFCKNGQRLLAVNQFHKNVFIADLRLFPKYAYAIE